jgi:AraC family transcriptional regulator, L-rhamnose operon regulatory protein RhaS
MQDYTPMERLLKLEQTDPWDEFSSGPGRHHETYEGKLRLLKETEIVGWLRFYRAFEHGLEADTHPGEFEIHYIVNGELHWWVEDSSYEMHSGMMMVIKPDELHGANTGVLEPCEQYWLRLAFPEKGTLPGLTEKQTQMLKDTFEAFKLRSFPVSLAVRRAFGLIIEEHRHPAKYSELICRSSLHTLLASVVRDHERAVAAADKPQAKISPHVQKSLRIIHKNLQEPMSVAEMAKLCNISETALRLRFREEVGCAPLDYITRRRIQEAKKLLAEGRLSITDIAYEMGFSSSQYFATVFKRITGVSPSHAPQSKNTGNNL